MYFWGPLKIKLSWRSSRTYHLDNRANLAFQGLPLSQENNGNQGLFVEIFAGTAGLTAAVRKVGLHASIGVDSSVNTSCRAPVIRWDLKLVHAQDLWWQILNRPNLIGVHLAPPCGTASRAREIVRKTGPSPKPLRGDKFPDGYPWLRGLNRDRVQSANLLYDLAGQVVAHCLKIGVVVSAENPARSHFWRTSNPFVDSLFVSQFWMHVNLCLFICFEFVGDTQNSDQ